MTMEASPTFKLSTSPESFCIIKCPFDGSIIMDKDILSQSPMFSKYLENNSKEILIDLKECHQETLELMAAFLKGEFKSQEHITPLNVQDLIIMADHVELQQLYNECTLWILRNMFLNEFHVSQSWKKNYREQYNEIRTLFSMILNINDIKDNYLQVTIKGSEYFQKLKEMKRFSELEVIVEETVTIPKKNVMEKMKSFLGFHKPFTSLRVKSLDFSHSDQSQLNFLNVSYPILETLILRHANLSDLSMLSNSLNHEKMPQLKMLDLDWNRDIQLNTLNLTRAISLTRLDLRECYFTDISPLMNLLDAQKLPKLKELNL